jgi:uncharacterized protein YraI
MRKIVSPLIIPLLLIPMGWQLLTSTDLRDQGALQQPTVDVPTVTGTPEGPIATVRTDNEQINVRNGPGVYYDQVGLLIAGEQVPALGRSAGGLWVQIAYAGVPSGTAWVYSNLVSITNLVQLPIIEPPPTSTPATTPTIDPILAAQFVLESPATRQPTFTAPPPLIIPTFEAQSASTPLTGVPIGLLIAFLGVLGFSGALVAFFQRR